MAKDKTIYVCSQCGNDSPKWVGKCPACGAWNAYVEQVVRKESPMQQARAASIGAFPTGKAVPRPFKDIETGMEVRIDMNDEELNRVLGGGLVPGSLVLLGGGMGNGETLRWGKGERGNASLGEGGTGNRFAWGMGNGER